MVQTELSATLGVSQDQTLITGCLNPWDVQSKHVQPEEGIAEALYSGECRGGGGESYVMQGINGEIAGTLDASYYKGCGERQGIEREVICIGNGQVAQLRESDKVGSLNCMHDQQAIITYGLDAHNIGANEERTHTLLSGRNDTHNVPTVCYGLDRASFNQGANAKFDFSVEEELSPTIVSRGAGGVMQTQ